MNIHGALTAMVTPFRDGKVDENRLRDQIEFQIKNEIDGLVPVGTTGESPTLDFKEHARVLELTVQFAAGRVPVIAGTGANATTEAIELHTIAKRVGANACLSVNPYYNKPSQEGMYRHFMAIAEKVDLPVVLYNIPSRTGVTMSAETIARLHRSGQFVAVKESTGSVDMAIEISSLCDITIISGDDAMTLALMAVGAAGIISVLSNLMPRQVKKMVTLARSGNFAEAATLLRRLHPLIKSLFADGNPAGIKYAMKTAGLDSGQLRLPLVEPGDATRKQIEANLSKLG